SVFRKGFPAKTLRRKEKQFRLCGFAPLRGSFFQLYRRTSARALRNSCNESLHELTISLAASPRLILSSVLAFTSSRRYLSICHSFGYNFLNASAISIPVSNGRNAPRSVMTIFTPPHCSFLKTEAFGVNRTGTNRTPGIARWFK